MRRVAIWGLSGLLVLTLLGCLGLGFVAEFVFLMIVGWVSFLLRVVPKVRVDPLSAVSAIAALAVFSVGLHFFIKWLCGALPTASSDAADGEPDGEPALRPSWSPRWTMRLVGLILVMFAAGISMVGITHQFTWLLRSKGRILVANMIAAERNQSANHLKQIGVGLEYYHGVNNELPAGMTSDRQGRMLHSWQTIILRYMEDVTVFKAIDLSQPWDAPDNAPHFRTVIEGFLNPSVQEPAIDRPDDFAKSHYAGNEFVLGGNRARPNAAFKDGKAMTIIAGEAADNFSPWGRPGNWRDPILGINQPGGFGGNRAGGATQFLMGDGSVRTLSEDVEPKVLRALATPDGGEPAVDPW